VRAHPFGHFDANWAVGNADDAAAEAGAQSDGAKAQDANSNYGHIFTGSKLGLVVTVRAERI